MFTLDGISKGLSSHKWGAYNVSTIWNLIDKNNALLNGVLD